MEAMSGQEETNEYLCLKLLLNKWKLPHLLHHFLAQKINVDILKMMKSHHIGEALSSFAIGDRIRFEYELENWREKMGIPLDGSKTQAELKINPAKQLEKANQTIENIPDIDKQKETMEEWAAAVPKTAPQSTTLTRCIKARTPVWPSITIKKVTQTPKESPNEMITPSNSSLNKRRQTSPAAQAPVLSTTKKRTNVAFVPPKELIAKANSNPLNLDARSILMQCTPRGPQLIKAYETRCCFTKVERGELINLFAKFFYQHSIHLSLKMSYILENQILKMFPGERLKDYRTEKRGRIYIRLGNIKNFKARTARAQRRQRSVDQFVISNVELDEEQSPMVDDELDEILLCDESNSPDHIACDESKTDVEYNSDDHFVYTEIKTEVQEDGLVEPETQLIKSEKS